MGSRDDSSEEIGFQGTIREEGIQVSFQRSDEFTLFGMRNEDIIRCSTDLQKRDAELVRRWQGMKRNDPTCLTSIVTFAPKNPFGCQANV